MSSPVSDPLAQEHAQLRAGVRQQRREFAGSVEGKFATVMWNAVKSYLRMREEGVPREDALKGLELVVREHWPRGRQREWKYLCDDCRDTGWKSGRCRPYARCKPDHDYLDADREHDFVSPCHCGQGDRFRRQSADMDSEAELAKVGRKRKTTNWSRPGR